MRAIYFAFILFCLVGNAAKGWAQQDSTNMTISLEDFFKSKQAELDNRKKPADLPILPDVYQPAYAEDSIVNLRYQEAMRGYFQYRIFGYAHRQKVFKWQLLSSKIIFVIVITLVFAGIYFSYLQFRKALKEIPADKIGNSLGGEGSLSKEGIRISSPVLGVIILFISLMFFYFYLLHVYPIEEIF